MERKPIQSNFDAEQALIRIKEANEEYDKQEETIDQMIEYYKEKKENFKLARDNVVEYEEQGLLVFFEQSEKKVTKTQETVTLPSGKLVRKKQAPEIKKDNETLVNYMKKNGWEVYVKTTETPEWGEFKKDCKLVGNEFLAPDGKKVEGLVVTERPDKFEVKL